MITTIMIKLKTESVIFAIESLFFYAMTSHQIAIARSGHNIAAHKFMGLIANWVVSTSIPFIFYLCKKNIVKIFKSLRVSTKSHLQTRAKWFETRDGMPRLVRRIAAKIRRGRQKIAHSMPLQSTRQYAPQKKEMLPQWWAHRRDSQSSCKIFADFPRQRLGPAWARAVDSKCLDSIENASSTNTDRAMLIHTTSLLKT